MLNALTFLTDLGYYDSDISSKIVSGLAAGFGVSSLLISLIIFILSIIGLWKIFDKAGVPGWYSLIPIANTYQLTKIATGNGWLFLLMLIPGLGLLAWYILIAVKLADAFGISSTYHVHDTRTWRCPVHRSAINFKMTLFRQNSTFSKVPVLCESMIQAFWLIAAYPPPSVFSGTPAPSHH